MQEKGGTGNGEGETALARKENARLALGTLDEEETSSALPNQTKSSARL